MRLEAKDRLNEGQMMYSFHISETLWDIKFHVKFRPPVLIFKHNIWNQRFLKRIIPQIWYSATASQKLTCSLLCTLQTKLWTEWHHYRTRKIPGFLVKASQYFFKTHQLKPGSLHCAWSILWITARSLPLISLFCDWACFSTSSFCICSSSISFCNSGIFWIRQKVNEKG